MRALVPALVSAAVVVCSGGLIAQSPPQPPSPGPSSAAASSPAPSLKPLTDLDEFMAQALRRRDIDRKMLEDYVLDDVESFDVLGPGRAPMMRQRREYTWFVQDGIHVRSPVKFDGVPIPESDRRGYEQRWIHSEQARQKFRTERDAQLEKAGQGPAYSAPSVNEPRFVSESYFMDFKFEPGNYYLAGKEQIDGHDVLKIDYVPTKLFDDDHKKDAKASKNAKAESDAKKAKVQQKDETIDRQMNKTSQVTLWVDPATHQIVKYTFDNVWLDFLPAQYLVKIDDMRASMVMEQPFPGVWLPRGIHIEAGLTMALGSFQADYAREFSNYRRADVASKIIIPKKGGGGQ
ncbi:MAG: hypothetical protein ACRD1V_11005 [Vicinamibacterales bacterium]